MPLVARESEREITHRWTETGQMKRMIGSLEDSGEMRKDLGSRVQIQLNITRGLSTVVPSFLGINFYLFQKFEKKIDA